MMQQMPFIDSYTLNKNVFNLLLNKHLFIYYNIYLLLKYVYEIIRLRIFSWRYILIMYRVLDALWLIPR